MRRPAPKRRCGHALIGLITESPVQATCPACRRRSSGCAAQRSRRTARRWRSGRPPPTRSIRRLSEDGFVPTVLVNAFRMKLSGESIPFAALHARKNQKYRPSPRNAPSSRERASRPGSRNGALGHGFQDAPAAPSRHRPPAAPLPIRRRGGFLFPEAMFRFSYQMPYSEKRLASQGGAHACTSYTRSLHPA